MAKPVLKKTSSLRLNLAPINRFYEDRQDPSSANVVTRQNNLFDRKPLAIMKINTANSMGAPDEESSDEQESRSVSDSCSSFDIYGNPQPAAHEQPLQVESEQKFIQQMMKQSCTSSSIVSKQNIMSI
mmetsp:Transcript_39307/g.60042  ORF Transcript_39307/g.60042 Transcript_39307/m.60042 type:complete len:128 (-) Transcript_39307:477-860(-)